MTLKDMTDGLLFWVSQWVGVTIPLIATLVLGLMLCTASVTALWTRRVRVAPALLGLVAGLFLVLVALDTRILHWLVSTSHLVRIRLVMGLLSLLVMGGTFEAVRRSRLKERYAILWMFTGGIILLCAFFPAILDFLTALLGMQYITAVGVVMFVFFLMVLFHVSLALSNIQEDETATAQRCALLEARLEELAGRLSSLTGQAPAAASEGMLPPIPSGPEGDGTLRPQECTPRAVRGFVVGVPVLIAAFSLAVLWSGLRAPQAMVGDEVTHYFMLTRQATVLPGPSFESHIPTGWGATEIRHYPHPNLWHYLGAWLYRAWPALETVQIYQTVFLVQLLLAAFLLIQRRKATTPAILLYLLLLASLPITLMFSMTFYQDVPVTAQIVTAFCLLDRRRWAWGTVFMVLALGMKVNAFLFLPGFLLMLFLQRRAAARPGARSFGSLLAPVAVSLVLFGAAMGGLHHMLDSYGGYYPYRAVRSATKFLWDRPGRVPSETSPAESPDRSADKPRSVSSYEAQIIANHPGDLRQPGNWFLYGGVLIWLVSALGLVRWVPAWRRPPDWKQGVRNLWPFWLGLSYVLPAAYMLKTAPDARFFLPALPFLLLPFVESFSQLPRQRIWMVLLVSLAIVQSGFVLAKAVQLRQVTPELMQGIAFLEKRPPPHNRVFMYPEGNYRLFPVEHDWYLRYRLREFWRGTNDERLALLARQRIGAIVVKKHLVGPVDRDIKNLGVYPDYFVRDIERDPRFRKVFDNPALAIYWIESTEDSGGNE